MFSLQILGRIKSVKDERKLDRDTTTNERESKRNITTNSLFHRLLRMATYTGKDSVYVKGHVATGILN